MRHAIRSIFAINFLAGLHRTSLTSLHMSSKGKGSMSGTGHQHTSSTFWVLAAFETTTVPSGISLKFTASTFC